MNIIDNIESRHDEIAGLFSCSFSDSEGATEGELIGALAKELLATTPRDDLFSFQALDADKIVGAIVFTRLNYPEDDRTVFLLSPVAIVPPYQGKGVGQFDLPCLSGPAVMLEPAGFV